MIRSRGTGWLGTLVFVAWTSMAVRAVAVESSPVDVKLTEHTTVHFADPKEGKALITANDRFVQAMSPFDRQARLGVDQPVSTEEYLTFAGEQVREWTAADRAKAAAALEAVGRRIEKWKLPLPERILLVTTTGAEESDAAYCRGAAIVLAPGQLAMSAGQLERLLTHELFHVLSTHNPRLREELYATIGYAPCDEIPLPTRLSMRKITNPDSPENRWYITLEDHGRPTRFVNVLYSKRDHVNPQTPGGFLGALEFKLLAVEQVDGKWRPALVDGEARLVGPRELPDYLEQVGRNTGYIIQPEEILAENFVLLMRGEKNVPSPGVLEKMEKTLKQHAGEGAEQAPKN